MIPGNHIVYQLGGCLRGVLRQMLMSFLMILPGISSRDIGLKFSGLFGDLPAVGISVTTAVLNLFGKYPQTRDAL